MPSAVIAITGASGSRYAVRLIQILTDSGWDIFLTVTREGAINLDLECGVTPKLLAEEYGVNLEANQNLAARSASGSAKFDAYVICPASGTTIGKIAAGISDNLATRSALVALKERRKLILVTRDTPLNLIHINNMKTITEAGGIICPATPSFYSNPSTFEELAATVVDRVISLSGLELDSYQWGNK